MNKYKYRKITAARRKANSAALKAICDAIEAANFCYVIYDFRFITTPISQADFVINKAFKRASDITFRHEEEARRYAWCMAASPKKTNAKQVRITPETRADYLSKYYGVSICCEILDLGRNRGFLIVEFRNKDVRDVRSWSLSSGTLDRAYEVRYNILQFIKAVQK